MSENRNSRAAAALLSFLLLPASLLAQADATTNVSSPGPAKPAGSAGLVNDTLREQSPVFDAWDLGGQVRARYELFDDGPYIPAPNRDFQRTGVDNHNSYLLLRELVHLGYKPTSWLNVYAEGRNSSSTGDDDRRRPSDDAFDLQQGYVVLGDRRQFPLTLEVGRQELIYGDERLIGASDWNNVPRAFDAAKLRYQDDHLWVDVFSGRMVIANQSGFNKPDDYDWFSGIYASTSKLLPWQETQLYLLSRNTGVGSSVSPRDIYTFGTRWKSLPGKLGGWDYTVEAAKQYGDIDLGNGRVNQDAMATAVAGGYTWKKAIFSPRLGVEYDYASGDSNPNDGTSETFDNLFPTNHKHYGYMDVIGWRNMHDGRFQASIKPIKTLTLSSDYHLLWLADTHDYFYPQSGSGRKGLGYGRNSDFSSFVGSELDLDVTYNMTSWAALRAGWGHFFVGEYIESSKASVGGASDGDWIYMQATLTF